MARRQLRRMQDPGVNSTFPKRSFDRDAAGEDELRETAPGEVGLRRSLSSGGSVASWVWNFDNEEGAELQSLFARGKYAEAKALGDRITRKVDANIRPILSLRYARGKGRTGDELAARAERMANGVLRSISVNVGGTDMTAEQALANDGDLAVKLAGDEFESLGMSRTVADMMFNGSDQQRAVFRGLVRPLMSGSVANRAQRIDLAEEVATNWDVYENAFGDGTAYIVQRLQDLHPASGGTVETLRALADASSAYEDLSGKELARKMVSGYEALCARVFGNDTSVTDASGRPTKSPISASKRMGFDSVLCSALRSCASRGVSVSLESPEFANAVSEVSDLSAYAASLGVDLVASGHDSGHPFAADAGSYVADAVTGLDTPSVNRVSALRGFRTMLDGLVTGGNDFATTAYRMTGNPTDYMASMNKANGGFSSSPGADAMSLGVKAYLLKAVSPGIMAGKDPASALNEAMSGSLHSGTDFLVGLSDVLAPHFYGKGRTRAADLVASRIIEGLSSGRHVSVEDTVFDLAFGGEDDGSDEQSTLRNWYSGNVTQAVRDAQKMTQLRAHLTTDEGMSDSKAASEVGLAAQEAAQMERAGRDWNKVYDARVRVGTVYSQVPDPANPGQPMVDPQTGQFVIRRIVDDRSKYGYVVGGDNSMYETEQKANREIYGYNKAFRTAAATASGRQSAASDD